MEAGFSAAPAMGQNPGTQDLIGTVSAISNSLMNEVSKSSSEKTRTCAV
jgi:hypothetical protein